MAAKQNRDFYPVDNFFDSEDFNEESPGAETLESVLKDVVGTYFLLPELNVDEGITLGDIDITGHMESIILRPEFSKEHKNPHMLEIYKPESDKQLTGGLVATLVIFPTEGEKRAVVFNIFSDRIRKEVKSSYPAPEERPKNIVEKLKKEAEEEYALQEIGVEFREAMELSGIDFVSEVTASRVVSILCQYRRHLDKHTKTPS